MMRHGSIGGLRVLRPARAALLAAVCALPLAARAQLHEPYCYPNQSYSQGSCNPGTNVAHCDTESFTRPRTPVTSLDPFTMIFASDTQWPWGSPPTCNTDPETCTEQWGTLTNEWFTRCMNHIETLGTWPVLVPNSGGQPI